MKKVLLTLITTVMMVVGCGKKEGCDDSHAINFDSDVEINNGSCRYADKKNSDSIPNNSECDTDSLNTFGIGHSIVISGDSAIDVDGNTYKSIVIGTQEWMAENLNTNKYNDGSAIATIIENGAWQSDTSGAYCYYNNDKSNYEKPHGAMYNWYAVNTGKLCPAGWHVPSEDDWSELTGYLSDNGHNGEEAKVLKTTSGWKDNCYNGTDNYGFNVLPSSTRNYDGSFCGVNDYVGYFWSSKEGLFISLNMHSTSMEKHLKSNGIPVRCLKD